MAQDSEDSGIIVTRCQRLSTHHFYIKLLIYNNIMGVNDVNEKIRKVKFKVIQFTNEYVVNKFSLTLSNL